MRLHCGSLNSLLLLSIFAATFVPCVSAGFAFSWSEPTECDNFTVTWQGGTGPYQLLFAPKFKVPLNFSIPDSAYDSRIGQGSFSLTLNVSTQTVFLLVMSDSTGFGSGGVSNALTVGNSKGGQCDTTDVKPAFTFETPLSLQQCRTYQFSYSGAILPVTIFGLIPSGTAFTLYPPANATLYNWTADVAAGTDLMFIMNDSQGRQGGSTDILGVGLSDAKGCLDSSSPSSTTRTSMYTQTQPGGTGTSTASPAPGGSGRGSSTAAIGGGVAGGIVALTAIALLVWWLRRRDQAAVRRRSGTSGLMEVSSRKRRGPVDLLPDSRDAQAHYPLNGVGVAHHDGSSPNDYEPVPYVLPPPPSARSRGDSADGSDGPYATYRSTTGAGGSTSYSKASEAALDRVGGSATTNGATRYILHTDAGSIAGSDEGEEEEEIVELPPQYDSLGHIIPQRQVSRRTRPSQRRPNTEREEGPSSLEPSNTAPPTAEPLQSAGA
ncbi:uncharacterized protein EI90DRAFT_3018799 [Cantharellus anzutake]|uniref:uncharacterized protein n=1 Tax=Cantharellus anzutake TaxID=1750568 RepID=UPI001902C2AF|nr:uncharacterized protein EI90DRAFT_3018799 [Cantharellus anzutake]KAF8326076.1 hypothetical protein EI90DRAFT_3018799 [Cantharellus anzutake]